MNKDLNKIKIGLAEMLRGGVIMDVTTPKQAKILEALVTAPPFLHSPVGALREAPSSPPTPLGTQP